MKKIPLILALVLLLCGCADDTPVTTAPGTTAPSTTQITTAPTQTTAATDVDRKSLAESCLEQSVEKLYDLLGQPDFSDYAPSCLQEGADDGMLYYEDFIVYTLRTDAGETVTYVE